VFFRFFFKASERKKDKGTKRIEALFCLVQCEELKNRDRVRFLLFLPSPARSRLARASLSLDQQRRRHKMLLSSFISISNKQQRQQPLSPFLFAEHTARLAAGCALEKNIEEKKTQKFRKKQIKLKTFNFFQTLQNSLHVVRRVGVRGPVGRGHLRVVPGPLVGVGDHDADRGAQGDAVGGQACFLISRGEKNLDEVNGKRKKNEDAACHQSSPAALFLSF